MTTDPNQLVVPMPVVHTTLTWGIGEVLIACGQTRCDVQEGPGGLPRMVNAAVYLAALSLSPPTAKLLALQLKECIEGYEARFGEIPTDLAPRVVPPPAEVTPLKRTEPPAAQRKTGSLQWVPPFGFLFDSGGQQDRHQPPAEGQPSEPEPSPSEPTA